jgi:hypothetical protein
VHAGERVPFVLTWTPSHLPRPRAVNPDKALHGTEKFWTKWCERSQAAGPYKDAVQRSLITLKALTYAPTGGIVAAATTSLPEQIGGSRNWDYRNWDYRYCWLRDATLTLQALLGAGYTKEAAAWREWLLRAVAGDPAKLQIMYSDRSKPPNIVSPIGDPYPKAEDRRTGGNRSSLVPLTAITERFGRDLSAAYDRTASLLSRSGRSALEETSRQRLTFPPRWEVWFGCLSRAMRNCPVADMKTARWWPWDLPSGGHQRRSIRCLALRAPWLGGSGQVGLGDGLIAVGT